MALLDILTGTKHPSGDAVPRTPEELRSALLALNGPQTPFRVRNATPAEGADLVAEWSRTLPAGTGRLKERTVKIRMRLVPETREVRALEELWEVTSVALGNTPGATVNRTYNRGRVADGREWTWDRGPDGRMRKTEVIRDRPAEMKRPVQGAVLDAGWTWRGVLFRL
ncbi:hypothetical protein [Streptomyces bambusae]|uniref:Uncharacterized protein n=1 Tax=Streptomyces bambusae TaxID=1550616 RepID=A0ABS6Z9C4_9ACTN|nr:hypothetical protein [Streptomyces bambusae]MBW5484361.1 hypothetical protein [Streptomyces bambusae]